MDKLNTTSLEKALDSLRRSIQVSEKHQADNTISADLKHTLQAGVIQPLHCI